MSITLKSRAKIELVKVYSMKLKKRELIDETFDKLHQQKKMHWTIESTVHSAFVFVVWRMINDERKSRVIVNIRELNKIIEFDLYSMSLQIDIISAVTEAKFISIIDVAAFFYQFRVRISDRHKLTIVSHQEQKYFSVALMNFKNSSAYAQRRIDIILRDLKHCCKAFIDDITIFSSTFEKHIKHLSVIFQRLLDYDIRLNSCKAFLDFSSIALLEQHVDEFDLHAIKNKIVVILNWKFLSTLKALKIYLEFIEWLRDYVAWYAQKIESLQQRKILLLKNSSSQREHARKAYVDRIIIDNRTTRKKKSFEMIQKTFKNSRFLTHFDSIRQFLIDVNAFKKEFEVFVYHIKKDREDMTKSTIIESIVFLSKILTSTKKRYWSTKLEVVVVVWIVKKLHHMIRASKHSTIIWTNHSITTSIVKQSKMFTSNTDKLNLRFVRVDMYLSQFDLDIRHKSKRDHVISDVLSRLSFFQNDEKTMKNSNDNILNDIDAYVETLMKMSIIFKNRLIEVYKTNREWSTLYEMLATVLFIQTIWRNINITKKSQNITHEEIEFERRSDLIYHLNRFISKARLCISRSLIKKIFRMTHDDFMHVDFHRAHVIIFETLYIRRLAHYLRQYIAYCFQCLLNQTKRHRSYDSFYSISTFKISFYTITMNFILTLSSFDWRKYDIMLTVIDKFFKTKLLISDLNNWKANDWVTALWKYLQLFNWDLFRVIIFDKNAKFRFDMWKFLFKTTKTDLFTSIAYHSQIDEQNERINQTIEIALRYLLISNSDLSWHEILSAMQHTLMNTIAFTEYSLNQTLYEMNIRSQITLLIDDFRENQQHLRDIIRKNVANVINFVSVRFKIIYDDKHKSLAFNIEDKVYLRLHNEYFLSKRDNLKLFNQRSDSYTIKRKIENVVYELNLSQNSRIHSVIFIAQLKSTSDSDSFNRLRSINSDSIETESDTSRKKSYEIERILKKRSRKYDRITLIEYLMQWKNWESKHNSWVTRKDCENVADLILKFENRIKNAWRASFFSYFSFFS
jgi:hypothetical protein